MTDYAELTDIRFTRPDAVAAALAGRLPGSMPEPGRKLLIIAADHPGRGILKAGTDDLAMADREGLLQRCMTALSRPGVGGLLATADVVEDLALLGALDGKLIFGSMNRSGLPGLVSEVDDRVTGWTPEAIVRAGLDGGKMLLRLDLADPRTPAMLERAARVVDSLAPEKKTIILEPFFAIQRDGRLVNDLSTEAVIRSATVASALGHTSARTWLKLPCVPEMERVVAATSLPVMLLGGAVTPDTDEKMRCWTRALQLPNVKGLAIGRALLYPPDGDVAGAVDRIVEVL